MFLYEKGFKVPAVPRSNGLLAYFSQASAQHIAEGLIPIRFMVTSTTSSEFQCEVGVISGMRQSSRPPIEPIFEFRRRQTENTQQFNIVLLVPTGIGSEIGGHAGDAGPVARPILQFVS